MMLEEAIRKIRDLEKLVLSDTVTKVNHILDIRKLLQGENRDVKIAATHSLRRLYIHFFEAGSIKKNVTLKDSSMQQYQLWLSNQFSLFFELLTGFLSSSDETLHALSIRTAVELIKFAGLCMSTNYEESNEESNFCFYSFRLILSKMIYSENEIDVEMLLLLRNEVLVHHDCIHYSLCALQSILLEMKESYHSESTKSPSAVSLKNVMDLMRIVSLPGQEAATADGSGLEGMSPNEETFLVNAAAAVNTNKNSNNRDELKRKRPIDADNVDYEDEVDDEEDKQFDDVAPISTRLRKTTDSKQQPHMKGLAALPVSQQLRRLECYRRVFSRCWLSLLALPLSGPQTKLILKHLPEHVMHLLTRPILLADFLTHCYGSGIGPIAVLALQSLFTLIVQHNLDYPHFFLSLYNLCSVEVFSAKYRTTFFSLLTRSLQSTNLPAYMVAAFAKRLAHLALHSPSCNSRFCVAQITWLLRKHPQCTTLLHHNNNISSKGANSQLQQLFNNHEAVDLEVAGGLQSSLWELLLLEKHFLLAAAELAHTVRDPRSTDNGRNGLHTRVEEHLTVMTYADLLTEQLGQVATSSAANKKKKLKQQQDRDSGDSSSSASFVGGIHTALSHRMPQQLLPPTSLVASCFGLP